MRVLIFGPSGSGKTYLAAEFKRLGKNAVDVDDINGLSSWFDGEGNKVLYKTDADQEFLENHSFLWDRKFLGQYLEDKPDIYVFGAAGNIFEMLDLFDKVYFLKIDPVLQKERLQHATRENPMGINEYQRENAVVWGKELEEEARKRNISFIDASLSPDAILQTIGFERKERCLPNPPGECTIVDSTETGGEI